ncbi:MAG: PAS domain S-box protein, partial [Chloroflexi bacterium]|nr:PAS domain S-box protein [Chloroflexota bacterium]
QGLHPDDREEVATAWYQMVQSHGRWGMEYRFQTPDGKTTWVYGLATPLHNGSGETTGYIGVNLDITARKQASEALRQSEARLKRAESVAHLGYYEIDVVAGTATWSDETFRIFALSPANGPPTIETYIDLIHPEDRRPVYDLFGACIESGDSFDLVYRIVRPNGEMRYVYSIGEMGGPADQPRMFGTIQDITPQKQAEEALRESEERYRALVETSPTAISVMRHGRYIFTNPAGARMLGYASPEEVAGQTVRDSIAPAYHDIVTARTFRLATGQPNPPVEIGLLRPDGSIVMIESTSVPIIYQGDPAILLIGQDITARKEAEAALRAGEARQRQVVEHMPVMLNAFDADENIIFWNRECERVTGYKAEEVLGHPLALEQLYPDEQYREQMLARAAELGLNFRDQEYTLTCKNGIQKTISWSNISGRVPIPGWHSWAVGVDVTARTLVQETLENSEARLRSIFRAAPIGIGLVSDRVILQANDCLCAMTNYSRDELIGQNARMLYLSDEDYEYVGREKYAQIQEHNTGTVETRWQRKDGEIIEVLLSSTPLDPDNLLAGVTFTALDITERKKVEQALQASEARYKAYIENAPDGIFVTDTSGRYVDVNPAACHMTGYSREELLHMSIPELVSPEAPPETLAIFDELEATGHVQAEVLLRKPDGTDRHTSLAAVALSDERYMAFCKDVTALKQTESKLHESEKRYRLLYQFAGIGVGYYTVDGTVIAFNEIALQHLAKDEAAVVGKHILELFPEEQATLYLTRIRSCVEHDHSLEFEDEVDLPSGTKWFLSVYSCVKDAGDQVLGVQIMSVDITALKQAEESLRRSEARYRSLFDNALEAILLTDDAGHYVDANPAACDLLGYTRDEILALSVWDITPPHNREQGQQAWDAYIAAGKMAGEYAVTCKDGTTRQTEFRAAASVLPGLHLSALRDITERKRSENLLQARVRLSEFALTHSLQELIRRLLDEAEQLTGSAIGFFHLVEPDQKTLQLQVWSTNTLENMCSAEGEGLHYPIDEAGVWVDCIHQRRPVIHNNYATLPHRKGMPDGHAPVVRELTVPVLQDDLIVAVLGVGNKPGLYDAADVNIVSQLTNIAWDVILRKRAEEALRESQERFRLSFEYSQLGMALVSLDGQFIDVNQRACDILGYTREELLATEFLSITHPGDRARSQAHYGRMLAGEYEGYTIEKRYLHRDGHVVWATLSIALIRETSSEPAYATAQLADITERQRAEAAEREQRAFATALAETAEIINST